VLKIYPISIYGNKYMVVDFSKTFDDIVGLYLFIQRKAEILGVNKKSFKRVINKELERYNRFMNGKVYKYTYLYYL